MLDEIHYPSYYLQRMHEPNSSWLRDHRRTKEPPYDKLNDRPGQFPKEPTRDEIREFLRQKEATLEQRRKEARESQSLSNNSFSPQAKTVRIDFRGATFTLDSTDEAGIKRIMNLINRG